VRFLVDECVDERIVKRLRSAGHDVASARDDLQGAADATLLDAARSERRIMVTEDKDFGRLAVS
jgi:predicted nuclease of predicted toxin-antitoxin system